MEIRIITVEQFFTHPGSGGLLAEYAEECASTDLPAPKPNRATYETMEKMGFMTVLGAFKDAALVGMCTVIVTPNPHYSVTLGVTESLFVFAAHRAGGAGRALLTAAEQVAKQRGAEALIVSAPARSALSQVLPMWGYPCTNYAHMKRLS